METQCGTRKPLTLKLHGHSWTRWMLVGTVFGHFLASSFSLWVSLLKFSLSQLCAFWSFFQMICSLLEDRILGFLDAFVASRSVSRHTWERGCCLSWQLLNCPGGLIGCQTSAYEKPTRWGKRQICQWKLNHLSTSAPPPKKHTRAYTHTQTHTHTHNQHTHTHTTVQQGKLYRPKGRLTSPQPWNRSD